MRALLWKDYRANQPVLFVGAVLLVAPYLVVVGWHWSTADLLPTRAADWAQSLFTAAHASLIASQLTIVLLAGNVIAGERRDRSAEFLAYLPPSRPAILASKSILCAATVIVIWGVSLVIVGLVVPGLDADVVSGSNREKLLDFVAMVAALGAALFGGAWLGSSMLESPTYSTAIGFFSVVLVLFLLNTCHHMTGWPDYDEAFVHWLRLLYAGVGAAGFVVGWTSYVRRVEP
ncbi:MAG TPA: ABC transporter permease subunit [Planctomycetaceae bacterium]|nr:ABC transporter permease subunit [Planctomycetaceae bacterium]